MLRPVIAIVIVLLCTPVSLLATVLHVPADQPTIQTGIDSAATGDTILVSPGTHVQAVDFGGKSVVLASEFLLSRDTADIVATVIDAAGAGPVVTFSGAEDSTTALVGFTLTGGTGYLRGDGNYYGGAIVILDTSSACPLISDNFIHDNTASVGAGGGAGAAIAVLSVTAGQGGVRLLGNRIYENSGVSRGTAVFIAGGAMVTLSGSLISANGDPTADSTTACIEVADSASLLLQNNTLVDNLSTAICLDPGVTVAIRDNIFWNNANPVNGIGAVFLRDTLDPGPTIEYNCFADSGSEFNCEAPGIQDTIHVNGNGTVCDSFFNIYRDPVFCSPAKLEVIDTSVCVGAATDSSIIGALGIGCYAYHGPIWHVSVMGDDSAGDGSVDRPFATVQRGVDQSVDGDTILLLPGTFAGPGNREVDFGSKALVLSSTLGPDSTVLDCGGGAVRGLIIDGGQDSACVVRGITITNADIGIFTSSSPDIRSVILSDNYAGVYSYASGRPVLCSLNVRACTKGLWCEQEDTVRTDWSTFRGNQYGVYLDGGQMTLSHCSLDSNTAAAVHVENGAVRCSFTAFVDHALALYSLGYDAEAYLDSCSLVANTTAVWGDCTADSCRFAGGNVAIKRVFRSHNSIRDCLFESIDTVLHDDGSLNKLGPAAKQQSLMCDLVRAEIRNCGQIAYLVGGTDGDYEGLSLDDCLVHDNSGGVWMDRGRLLMQGTEYRNNGRGIYVDVHGQTGEDVALHSSSLVETSDHALRVSGLECVLSLDDVLIANNNGDAVDVAVFAHLTASIDHVTIVGNIGRGVAVDSAFVSTVTVANSVIAYNDGQGLLPDSTFAGITVTCTDVFGNAGGNYGNGIDLTGSGGNTSVDPLFCDTAVGDYSLYDVSACVASGGDCDSILGATEIGCYASVPWVAGIFLDTLGDSTHVLSERPVIFWQFTDTAGNLQERVELEVGDDSIWDVAELWSSGTLMQGDTSAVYDGLPLVDGVRYFIRVRVHNSWRWSEWTGTSFRTNSNPTGLSLLWPVTAVVRDSLPQFWLGNAADAEGDSVNYDIQGLPDSACIGGLPFELPGIDEAADSTSALLSGTPLIENCTYWWRARACDAYECSPWTAYAAFAVNAVPESPVTAPVCLQPPFAGDSIVYELLSEFIWTGSTDPDPGDTVYYELIVAEDSTLSVAAQVDTTVDTAHRTTDSLPFHRRIFWSVTSLDQTGHRLPSGDTLSFWTWTLGDIDHDHVATMGDLSRMIDYLFISYEPIDHPQVGDLDGDCAVNMGDLTVLIDYLFISYRPLVIPGCAPSDKGASRR